MVWLIYGFREKRDKCGLKLVFPPRRWCGINRGFEKVVWLCGLNKALDGTKYYASFAGDKYAVDKDYKKLHNVRL